MKRSSSAIASVPIGVRLTVPWGRAQVLAPARPLVPGAGTTTETLAPPVVSTDDGDHERLAHIVYPKDKLTEALITGTPVTALCGKVWTPSREPERYPVCPGCVDAFETILGRPWPGRR